MRILNINSAKTFGGGERHFVDLINGLQKKENEIFIAVVPDSPILEKLPDFPKENILEVNIKNSLDIFGSRKLAGFIKQNDIEIVHAHTGKDYLPSSLAVRLAKTAKLILTRHVLFPLKTAQKIALANISKVIAVSAAVESNLQKTFPMAKIVKIHNGILIENWSETNAEKLNKEFRFFHNIPYDAHLIGTIGELKVLKGQRDFVLAANEIAKKTEDVFFIIVGKDNSFQKEFRGELKRLVKIFGLKNQFLFLNWLEDTAPLLSAIDIFVSPSHSESFGLAILEAMASGKAIISTETEGAKELIENGKSGKLVRVKEPLEIAGAIEEFLNDEKMRETYGANAQKNAREKFSLNKMITETENVYKSVLD
jgi:L-malate glycosyltransferase